MKGPFIFLCPEISRDNAISLIKWLKDDEVRKYLSDSKNVVNDIEEVVNRVNLPILTHLFNQNSRFYMVYNKANTPVGFVRLIPKGDDYEIVIVIGDRENWNKKLGTNTIRESIKIAFFEFRAKRVVAKIYKENTRSIKAFLNVGFTLHNTATNFDVYTLSMSDYIQLLQQQPLSPTDIFVTDKDKKRIKNVIKKVSQDKKSQDKSIRILENEIERAIIIDSYEIAPDVVTMNSKALLQLNDKEMLVSLVYPEDENKKAINISVFSPIGTAIIGYKEGSIIDYETPKGSSKIHIKKLIYQPEAEGCYHL